MKHSLEVERLSKRYPDSKFKLDDINFNIPKGTIVGLVGENGAGKTTTISIILNIISKDSGEVKLFGKEMHDEDTIIREDIGVVFDAINFPETLTPTRLSKVMDGIYKKWDKEYFIKLLERWNIPLNRKFKEFSRGMSMKLSIATALSHHPRLLILDEATSGLDPIAREEMLDVFLEFVEDENNSILISSHITSDLEKIADYITFIDNGKVILTEEKDQLIYDYGIARCDGYKFENIEDEDVLAFRKKGFQFDILVNNKTKFKDKYRDIIVDSTSIEEIMLLLLKGDEVNERVNTK